MSFQAMTWATAQKCGSASSKLVLLMLANHSNGHTGQCNPRHKTLAEECEMRVETLKTHMKNLEALGLITIVHKFADGVQLPNQYVLNMQGGGGENRMGGGGENRMGGGGENRMGGGGENRPPNKQELNQEDKPIGGERAQAPAPTPAPAPVSVLPEVAAPAPVVAAPVVTTPAPAQPEKPKAQRKASYPADFAPNETAVAMACSLRVSLETELASFADFHTAKGSTMADWQAAFRTWLRNAAKFAKQDATRRGGQIIDQSAPVETYAQRAARQRVEEISPMVARKAPGERSAFERAQDFMNGGDIIDVTENKKQIGVNHG